jgi:hypothetical protein
MLRGVAGAELNPDLAMRLCRRCHDLPSRPLGRWIPPVIAKLASSALSDEAIEIVAWYATEDPDPERELWRTDTDDNKTDFGGSIDVEAINSVRGVAAEAVGILIFTTENGSPNCCRLSSIWSPILQSQYGQVWRGR